MSLRLATLLALTLTQACFQAGVSQRQSGIEHVLTRQVEAWNRGDIPGFVATYADDCTFVGKQTLQGRSKLLARYQKAYPSPAAMGKLSFANLSIRRLDAQIATAIGEWRIDRPNAAGGPIGGVFSLVLRRREGAWQIVLDHTT